MANVSPINEALAFAAADRVQQGMDAKLDPLKGDLRNDLVSIKSKETVEPALVSEIKEKYPAVQSMVDLVREQDTKTGNNIANALNGTATADSDKPAEPKAQPSPPKPTPQPSPPAPTPKPKPSLSDQTMLRSQAQAEYAHDLLKAGEDPASHGGRINKLVDELAKSERGDPAIKDWVKSHYSDVQKLVDKAASGKD